MTLEPPSKKICLEVKKNEISEESDWNHESSSDELHIDISESPKRKKDIDFEDKQILEDLEDEIEKQLDEKAAKTNLTATNVKNILRQVITNEHVLAMVRHTVGINLDSGDCIFEPKLTRAKAKELFKDKNVTPLPWTKEIPKSEIHILVNEELPEDSDDDEYVPNEYETEDDKEGCNTSDVDSQPHTPATQTVTSDSCTQTNWTEDGVFKIPPTKDQETKKTENIALRTRSKLSLNDTPLEIIEEAFIPPDITTDMYDVECDDEDWGNFLKEFTRPLNEVQGTQEDDDDADPEYNVLADEEIDIVDKDELKEELREDRGVQVSKKEFNNLVAELFEFSDMLTFENEEMVDQNKDTNVEINPFADIDSKNMEMLKFEPEEQVILDASLPVIHAEVPNEMYDAGEQQVTVTIIISITHEQRQLLDQQLRLHVQFATQFFLLSCEHPELSDLAPKFKGFLISMYESCEGKEQSAFRTINLLAAIDLVQKWETYMQSDRGLKTKEFVKQVIETSREQTRKALSCYPLRFPPDLMKVVIESPVFIYVRSLPNIPFRCNYLNPRDNYLRPEDQLIALGLEQFMPYLAQDPAHISHIGKVKLADVAFFIQKYMLPGKNYIKMYNHIRCSNLGLRYSNNPIRYYFQHKKAPEMNHQVLDISTYGILPPHQRSIKDLPQQWQEYVINSPLYIPIIPVELDKPNTNKRYIPIAPKFIGTESEVRFQQTEIYGSKSSELKILPKETITSVETTKRKTKRKTSKKPLKSNGKKKQSDEVDVVEHDVEKVEESTGSFEEKREFLKEFLQLSKDVNKTDGEKLTLPAKKPAKKSAKRKRNKENHVNTSDSTEVVVTKATDNASSTSVKIPAPISKPKQGIQITIPIENSPETNSSNNELNNSKTKYPNIPADLLNFKFNSSIFKQIELADMLPSMPFLLTPSKEHPSQRKEVNKSPETVDKPVSTVVKREIDDYEVEATDITDNTPKKDNQEELNALMVASSTVQRNRKLSSCAEKKKAKQRKEYNATLAILSPEDKSVVEEKADKFAQAFYDKVQERLEADSPEDYQKFMEALNEHNESRSSVSELYGKIESVLSPNHQDLCEEFLTFLTPEQAKQIGKLVPHFMLSNMSLFLRKLEIYYSNQPTQLRKIYKGLTDLANNPDVTMDNVKSAILPLLKGSNLLVDWFLQMFPTEAPPESLMTDWEQIECNDGDDENRDQKKFETIILPEVEDPYGGPNCICKCHQIAEEMYASRARHCIPCGTKFLQGRVYVQTGKGLRLANVTFNNSPNCDHNKRLNVKPKEQQKRKIDSSPNKTLMSPVKDDEPRPENESEDDVNLESNSLKKQKSPKPSTSSSGKQIKKKSNRILGKLKIDKKETSKPKKEPTNTNKSTAKTQTIKTKKNSESINETSEEIVCKSEPLENTQCKIEIVEHDLLEYEMKSSPVESMDTCEESSQDTTDVQASDTDNDSLDESIDSENSDEPDETCTDNENWTRDEDKIILQTFQKYGNSNNVFKDIQNALSRRSLSEIKHRFQKLMNLLQQMTKQT